jgi:hypothetical protein
MCIRKQKKIQSSQKRSGQVQQANSERSDDIVSSLGDFKFVNIKNMEIEIKSEKKRLKMIASAHHNININSRVRVNEHDNWTARAATGKSPLRYRLSRDDYFAVGG